MPRPRDAERPDVIEALDARYPDDEATGYREDEFRGLIRITVLTAVFAES